MADLVSRITDLKADFQRIADRAPWVRAGFTVKAGKFGMFVLGHPVEDGTALVESLHNYQELAIITELEALTDQAGSIAEEVCAYGRYRGKLFSQESINNDFRHPRELWRMLLLLAPPTCFLCRAKGQNGREWIALSLLGEGETAAWIDNYPQACVSALASLKANVKPEAIPELEAGPTTTTTAPSPPTKPAAYLWSWQEILDCLGLKNNKQKRDLVRKLNDSWEGPIILPKQGGQPVVIKEELRQWWNDLKRHIEEKNQKDVDTRATVEAQHGYGKDGVVVPEIGGHVKKRRQRTIRE
jgi:hypothetical protein